MGEATGWIVDAVWAGDPTALNRFWRGDRNRLLPMLFDDPVADSDLDFLFTGIESRAYGAAGLAGPLRGLIGASHRVLNAPARIAATLRSHPWKGYPPSGRGARLHASRFVHEVERSGGVESPAVPRQVDLWAVELGRLWLAFTLVHARAVAASPALDSLCAAMAEAGDAPLALAILGVGADERLASSNVMERLLYRREKMLSL